MTDKRPIICEPCGHECDVMTPNDFGKIAYDAYCASVDGLSVHGEPLPTWDEQLSSGSLHPEVAKAWMRAAGAVRSAVARQLTERDSDESTTE